MGIVGGSLARLKHDSQLSKGTKVIHLLLVSLAVHTVRGDAVTEADAGVMHDDLSVTLMNQASGYQGDTGRNLLQVTTCEGAVWICSSGSTSQDRVPAVVYASISSSDCTVLSASLGLWRCSQTLVSEALYNAVANGSCQAECSDQTQRCTAPPGTPFD